MNRINRSKAHRTNMPVRVIVTASAAIVLALSAIPTQAALAYYSFGTVGVNPGAASLSVQAGSTTSTNVSVTPASHDQTQGCGMAKCPQVCDSSGAIEAGYHCFDANGQCTCAGREYSTYYPQVTCVSSNAGVASAYMEGSTLVVTGRSAGTATITVNASLRQWNSGSSTVTVNVTAPASNNSGSNGGNAGTGANKGNGNTGGTSSNKPAENTGSSEPSASAGSSNTGSAEAPSAAPEAAAPSASGIPQAADPSAAKDDGLNEQTVETTSGEVTSVQANSYLDTAAELKKIAGKKAQLIIWSGASSENPDWSMTFWGEDVDPNSPNLKFDPAITVSDLGTGTAANIAKQAKDARVMEFAYSGDLPAKASVYVKAGSKYPDGTELNLFRYDAKALKFNAEGSDKLKVDGGYFSFTVAKGGTFAVSTDDLASYKVLEENTPGAARKQKAAEDSAAATSATAATSSSNPVLIAGAVAVVVIAAAVIALALARRHRAREAAAASAPTFEPEPVEGDGDKTRVLDDAKGQEAVEAEATESAPAEPEPDAEPAAADPAPMPDPDPEQPADKDKGDTDAE